jgi:predicted solute-binding protein
MQNQFGHSSCVLGHSEAWSLNPLLAEFGRLEQSVRLVSAPRKVIENCLVDHSIDIGLCSSTSLLHQQLFELAMPLGESVRGPSGLSYLVIHSDNGELIEVISERVARMQNLFSLASGQSIKSWAEAVWSGSARVPSGNCKLAPFLKLQPLASSWSQLARLFYRLLFGQDAFALNEMRQKQHAMTADDTDGSYLELKCGNAAICQRRKYQHSIDLSGLWSSVTSLPFVPTIALKHKKTPYSAIPKQSLFTAADLAQAKMRVEPSSYLAELALETSGGQLLDLSHLWRKVHYRLGGEEVKSLRLLMHLLRPLERQGLSDERFHLEMVRWQQRDSDGSLYLS